MFVRALAETDATMKEFVGGKAANLGEMLSRGFAVPEGFCVTTTAYVRAELVPREIEDAITRAYEELSGSEPVAVAVRSSSTAEDLPDASFAGQYDTYLNVRGSAAVLDAVRQCWGSLWTARATHYRENHCPDADPVIAVVVQKMVDAAFAGVLYTANPVTGNRAETVVEAAPGLGEAVVSGTVTPDHYRLTEDGEPAGGGCLSTSDLSRLTELGQALETAFGSPQDVEWAIDGDGELWITQSRPITTLFPVPEPGGEGTRAYWSVNVYQGISRPFTPMGAFFVRERQRGMSKYMSALGFSAEISTVDGWLYWDITDGVRDESKRDRMAAFVDSLAAPTGRIVTQLGADPRFPAVLGETAASPGPRRRRWERMVPALLWPDAARARVLRRAEELLGRFAGPAEATAEQRLEFVESVHSEVCRIEANLPRDANTAGSVAQQRAAELLGEHATAAEITTAFGGVPHNPTTEMDLALWRLATALRSETPLLLGTAPGELAAAYAAETLPPNVHNGVTEFLSAYGCRATAEIDLGVPRWSDDPEPVFAMLANFLRAPEEDAERRFAGAAAAAIAKIDELAARVPPPRRWLVRFLLHRSRALRGLREFPKLCLMRGFALLRAQLLAIGAELVTGGKLAAADDIVFLDLPEVRAAVAGEDFRATVADRKACHEREKRRQRVPSIILSDGTVPELDGDGTAADLTGLAASAGRVTGAARVVHDPDGARVEPGEILVAATTDPGWTPLFLTAAALVTETGGMISHGTTIAREYGIPAVVGVPGATRRIRTGQVITVDGSAGTILLG
ncbi:PEP/pyruvate-binding domain-containing protein [Amycolatopsis minnesotensis]|uniref:Phosphoenolpyruvate synthase n=1 Tax=Amycolatopsis minnesotensis TaxID=337894 RepID=A0ABN2S1E3_9PSEU